VAKIQKSKTICGILVLGIIFLHITCLPALAEEGSGDWRPMYDTIMVWVNFLILVYLIYRIGRKPFQAFLSNQANQVSGEIQKAEKQKQEVLEAINETKRQMQESSDRYDQIKARIIEEGRRLRQELIDEARSQGEQMLEREKNNASRRIAEGRKKIMTELVDAAANMAQNRLPGEINQEDQSKLVEFYIRNISKA
jgi:F-type H+-transporting ATPase subunit b